MRQPLQSLRGTGSETRQGPSCIPGPQLPWVLNSSSPCLAPLHCLGHVAPFSLHRSLLKRKQDGPKG